MHLIELLLQLILLVQVLMVSELRLQGRAEEVITWRIHVEVVELEHFLDRLGCFHVLNLLRICACLRLGRRA